MTNALRDALAELVALQDFMAHHVYGGEWVSKARRLEYFERHKIAMEAARAALAAQPAPEGAAISASREDALQTLAKFAKTAPGRLPQRIEDAIALAAQPAPEGVSLPDLPEPWDHITVLRGDPGPDGYGECDFEQEPVFSGQQMQDYARAALAARQGVSLTDEPAAFKSWWESMAPAPHYPGIERRIALNAWRAALAIQGAGALPTGTRLDPLLAFTAQVLGHPAGLPSADRCSGPAGETER